ncbi:MAG: hypothetical protein LBO73_00575 [Holosporaceae bacterium]|jgi:hypothetical protein|nr:hypothetical protein [Holosporaceae bacterium]
MNIIRTTFAALFCVWSCRSDYVFAEGNVAAATHHEYDNTSSQQGKVVITKEWFHKLIGNSIVKNSTENQKSVSPVSNKDIADYFRLHVVPVLADFIVDANNDGVPLVWPKTIDFNKVNYPKTLTYSELLDFFKQTAHMTGERAKKHATDNTSKYKLLTFIIRVLEAIRERADRKTAASPELEKETQYTLKEEIVSPILKSLLTLTDNDEHILKNDKSAEALALSNRLNVLREARQQEAKTGTEISSAPHNPHNVRNVSAKKPIVVNRKHFSSARYGLK